MDRQRLKTRIADVRVTVALATDSRWGAFDDAVYGAFSGRGQIDAEGKQAVAASAARYISRISE